MIRLFILSLSLIKISDAEPYYGKLIGNFNQSDVQGQVWAADPWRIYIRNFVFDGSAESAYFIVGRESKVSRDDMKLTWGNKSTILRKFENENVKLKSEKDLEDPPIKHLTLWASRTNRIIAQLLIPDNFQFPYYLDFGPIKGKHNVSMTSAKIIDTRTIKFTNFYYDGKGPAAYFLVGVDSVLSPNGNGRKILIDNRDEVVREYKGENLTLRLPKDISFFDVKWLSLYCIKFKNNFFHVNIPAKENLNVPADMSVFDDVSKGFDSGKREPIEYVTDAPMDPFVASGSHARTPHSRGHAGHSDHQTRDQEKVEAAESGSNIVQVSSTLLPLIALRFLF